MIWPAWRTTAIANTGIYWQDCPICKGRYRRTNWMKRQVNAERVYLPGGHTVLLNDTHLIGCYRRNIVNANYQDSHGNKKPVRVSNDLHDYLQEAKGWVGADLDSRTKFAMATAKQFNLPLEEATAAIEQVFGSNYHHG